MKTVVTILTILISISCLGQKVTVEQEMKQYFFNLPIDKEIDFIIDSAKNCSMIEAYKDNDQFNRPYFSGYVHYLNSDSVDFSGQIEIFRSKYYTLWVQELDSIDIISLRFDYGNKNAKTLKKDYRNTVRKLKSYSSNSEKYKLFAEPGKIGYGVCFFEQENGKLPFCAVEIGLGDCVSKSQTLILKYFKL